MLRENQNRFDRACDYLLLAVIQLKVVTIDPELNDDQKEMLTHTVSGFEHLFLAFFLGLERVGIQQSLNMDPVVMRRDTEAKSGDGT